MSTMLLKESLTARGRWCSQDRPKWPAHGVRGGSGHDSMGWGASTRYAPPGRTNVHCRLSSARWTSTFTYGRGQVKPFSCATGSTGRGATQTRMPLHCDRTSGTGWYGSASSARSLAGRGDGRRGGRRWRAMWRRPWELTRRPCAPPWRRRLPASASGRRSWRRSRQPRRHELPEAKGKKKRCPAQEGTTGNRAAPTTAAGYAPGRDHRLSWLRSARSANGARCTFACCSRWAANGATTS